MKELVVIYEREQIEEVCAYQKAHGAEIVALDYWVEEELRQRGALVHSLSEYCEPRADFSDELYTVEELGRQWYQLPEVSFFSYKGLSMGEMIEMPLYLYLQQVKGYLLLFERICKTHADITRLVVPYSHKRVQATAGPYASYEIAVAPTVGAFYARHKGLSFSTIGVSDRGTVDSFPKRSVFISMAFLIYNTFIRLAPRRSLKILVSDHWRNVKTIVETMDDAELVFIDRKEIRNIPLKQLIKHRIRFIHPLDVLSTKTQVHARAVQKEWRSKWGKAKSAVGALPGFIDRDGLHWWEVVEPVMSAIVEGYSERLVADVDSIERILVKECIHRVLVRASVSGQHHFFILGELAPILGIPSLEIQHGIGVGTISPHSVFGLLHAQYLAAYGPMIQRTFIQNGYDERRIRLTGSPRFDRYYGERDTMTPALRHETLKSLGLNAEKPVGLVVMPAEHTGFPLGAIDLTSYEFKEYLDSLKDILDKTDDLQLILKFRSEGQQNMYRSYLEDILPQQSVVCEHGDLFSLALLCDFVISPFSTAVIECLMARKPVILYPLKRGERYFYETHKEGVIQIPLLAPGKELPTRELFEAINSLIHDKKFYADAVRKSEHFLQQQITFTGNSTERVMEIVKRMSPRTSSHGRVSLAEEG